MHLILRLKGFTAEEMMPKVPVLAIVNMQIFVDVTRSKTFKLDVNSNDSINDVKLRIEA